MLRDVISFILGNIQIPLFAVAIVTTIARQQRAAARHEVVTFTYTFWGEVLFYCVGVGLVYAWYVHAFLSPIRWDLAWAELGLAIVALLSLWRGYEMRLAATVMYAVLSFGAAGQRIHSPAGLTPWFGEIALPALLVLLALGARDAYERSMGRSRI